MLARVQNENNGYPDRRKDRDDRRRSQAQPGNMVPPSPALVRHGSKQRKVPAALTPGQMTPHSAAAQVHIPIGSNQRASGQHPYANAGIGAGYEYSQQHEQFKNQQQPYGRTSPMVTTGGPAPVAISNVRARAGEVGVAQDYQGQSHGQYGHDEQSKPSIFVRIFTCRC